MCNKNCTKLYRTIQNCTRYLTNRTPKPYPENRTLKNRTPKLKKIHRYTSLFGVRVRGTVLGYGFGVRFFRVRFLGYGFGVRFFRVRFSGYGFGVRFVRYLVQFCIVRYRLVQLGTHVLYLILVQFGVQYCKVFDLLALTCLTLRFSDATTLIIGLRTPSFEPGAT